MSLNSLTAHSSTNPFYEELDIAHQTAGFFDEPLSVDVWRDKYKWETDNGIFDMCFRVANSINAVDGDAHILEAYHAMAAGLWIPAGRVLAGAGTGKRVTLINCFVNARLEDSMDKIMEGVSYTALTMQQGGGMGTNFSTLRPENAVLKRTHTKASGPLPFMDMWNGMSKTIRSAGDRRGAMMGTLCDTHPDLPKFIKAKREAGRLSEFNVSVLVSDALMEAIAENEEWLLHFDIPPMDRDSALEQRDFEDEDGIKQFVYSVWRARDLWELITRNTYEYSEPGVIFIDRVNAFNNLQHVEEIFCTNPCGEQPLPAHGACDLGHVNVARMVLYPYTERATFNWDLLRRTVRLGQRFLDNVLDVTGYPLPEQHAESMYKRRTGLGHTGLADAMMQLRMRYGSPRSQEFAEMIQREIAYASYEQNVELAVEKGPCPAFDPCMAEGDTFISQRLPPDLKKRIKEHGLRNGVALTVAPTGTISVVFGNLSGSGCEAAFAHIYDRRVRQPSEGTEDVYKTYKDVKGYALRLYEKMYGQQNPEALPSYFATAQDLSVEDHVAIQAAVQRWTDASVSKTVNVPKEMEYEDFVKVYSLAYSLGCKGCTTYRPSDIRGSILSVANAASPKEGSETISKRPEVLGGQTYQLKWPKREAALYITINQSPDGRPAEILAASKDSSSFEWVTALTLMITAILKKGGDVSFVANELKQVQSVSDASWVDGKFYGSLVAYIGSILERHFSGKLEDTVTPSNNTKMIAQPIGTQAGELCPSCKAPAVIRAEGCKKCTACTWSSC